MPLLMPVPGRVHGTSSGAICAAAVSHRGQSVVRFVSLLRSNRPHLRVGEVCEEGAADGLGGVEAVEASDIMFAPSLSHGRRLCPGLSTERRSSAETSNP